MHSSLPPPLLHTITAPPTNIAPPWHHCYCTVAPLLYLSLQSRGSEAILIAQPCKHWLLDVAIESHIRQEPLPIDCWRSLAHSSICNNCPLLPPRKSSATEGFPGAIVDHILFLILYLVSADGGQAFLVQSPSPSIIWCPSTEQYRKDWPASAVKNDICHWPIVLSLNRRGDLDR